MRRHFPIRVSKDTWVILKIVQFGQLIILKYYILTHYSLNILISEHFTISTLRYFCTVLALFGYKALNMEASTLVKYAPIEKRMKVLSAERFRNTIRPHFSLPMNISSLHRLLTAKTNTANHLFECITIQADKNVAG